MTDDLVKRLREYPLRECREAADRIEKLEAELVQTFNNMMEDAKRIETLEAALREIHEVYAGSEGIPEPMTAAESYLLRLLTEMVGVTRKALEGKDDV